MSAKSIKFCRRLFLFGVLCAGVVCVVGVAQQTANGAVSAQSNQQKARALLDRMIETLGGPAYLNLEDSDSTGRYGRFYHESPEASIEFHRLWEWPRKERVEFTKQRDVIELNVGDQMYEITFRGTRTLDPQKDFDSLIYLERSRHALDVILREWLKQPGVALFDEGPALSENHSVERISIITANNDAVSLSIDTDTHLPVKKTFVMRDQQGYRDEIGEVYDNWKMIQGVNTPFSMVVTRNGEISRQYFFTTVTYNNHPQESLFQPGSSFNLKKK